MSTDKSWNIDIFVQNWDLLQKPINHFWDTSSDSPLMPSLTLNHILMTRHFLWTVFSTTVTWWRRLAKIAKTKWKSWMNVHESTSWDWCLRVDYWLKKFIFREDLEHLKKALRYLVTGWRCNSWTGYSNWKKKNKGWWMSIDYWQYCYRVIVLIRQIKWWSFQILSIPPVLTFQNHFIKYTISLILNFSSLRCLYVAEIVSPWPSASCTRRSCIPPDQLWHSSHGSAVTSTQISNSPAAYPSWPVQNIGHVSR